MKINNKKIAALLLGCLLSGFAVYAADSGASSYTSADDVKKAQVAMATNEYIVTAGDIYTLGYSGGTFSISVDSTYRVRIANLGIVNAKGLTFQEFKNKVESLIISNYPTTGVQFLLANPAQFHVYVKGEVTNNATVETWAMARASGILSSYCTPYASRRLFSIISSEGIEKEYDLFKSTRAGDFDQDPYLRPGDTIVVKKLDRSVSISGDVRRPGTYELLPGEELRSLIFDYADGFAPSANRDSIQIDRYTGKKDMYETSYIRETDLHSEIPLACYDSVTVASNSDTRSVVYVNGAVSNRYDYTIRDLVAEVDDNGNEIASLPGDVTTVPSTISKLRFPMTNGKTWNKLIIENHKMFLNSSDLHNSIIWRTKASGEKERIDIDIYDILYTSDNNDSIQDILVMPNDVLEIPFTQYFVSVTGAVNAVGKYAYQPGKTWTYYVGLANGFDMDQNLFGTIKITDKNGKKLSKKDEIPPEATIYASRNSPNKGWLIPLITSIISFATTCLTFFTVIISLK